MSPRNLGIESWAMPINPNPEILDDLFEMGLISSYRALNQTYHHRPCLLKMIKGFDDLIQCIVHTLLRLLHNVLITAPPQHASNTRFSPRIKRKIIYNLGCRHGIRPCSNSVKNEAIYRRVQEDISTKPIPYQLRRRPFYTMYYVVCMLFVLEILVSG